MTTHIAKMLRLEPESGGTLTVHTHYVPAYAPCHPSDRARQAGICGRYVPLQQHSLDPSCPECQTALQGDDEPWQTPPPPSPPCLDGSTEACVPGTPFIDVVRCVYCRREMRHEPLPARWSEGR